MADIASPDTWIVRADNGEIISETIAVKKDMVVLRAGGKRVGHVGGGAGQESSGSSVTVPVPLADQARSCLTREQLNGLVALGRMVEKHYKV